MAYTEFFTISHALCRDFWLREKLRCEYGKTEHELGDDFPPDLILRDQKPPDVVLLDEVTNETWGIDFRSEIIITRWGFVISRFTGIQLPNNVALVMRNGELVVTDGLLSEPKIRDMILPSMFLLSVVNGELVYGVPDEIIKNYTIDIAWKINFREEITVDYWTYPIPYNGVFLNDGWVMQMIAGEIVLTQGIIPPLPYLVKKPDKWKFQLNVTGGELVYVPFAS
jgi:hypothetical protein